MAKSDLDRAKSCVSVEDLSAACIEASSRDTSFGVLMDTTINAK